MRVVDEHGHGHGRGQSAQAGIGACSGLHFGLRAQLDVARRLDRRTLLHIDSGVGVDHGNREGPAVGHMALFVIADGGLDLGVGTDGAVALVELHIAQVAVEVVNVFNAGVDLARNVDAGVGDLHVHHVERNEGDQGAVLLHLRQHDDVVGRDDRALFADGNGGLVVDVHQVPGHFNASGQCGARLVQAGNRDGAAEGGIQVAEIAAVHARAVQRLKLHGAGLDGAVHLDVPGGQAHVHALRVDNGVLRDDQPVLAVPGGGGIDHQAGEQRGLAVLAPDDDPIDLAAFRLEDVVGEGLGLVIGEGDLLAFPGGQGLGALVLEVVGEALDVLEGQLHRAPVGGDAQALLRARDALGIRRAAVQRAGEVNVVVALAAYGDVGHYARHIGADGGFVDARAQIDGDIAPAVLVEGLAAVLVGQGHGIVAIACADSHISGVKAAFGPDVHLDGVISVAGIYFCLTNRSIRQRHFIIVRSGIDLCLSGRADRCADRISAIACIDFQLSATGLSRHGIIIIACIDGNAPRAIQAGRHGIVVCTGINGRFSGVLHRRGHGILARAGRDICFTVVTVELNRDSVIRFRSVIGQLRVFNRHLVPGRDGDARHRQVNSLHGDIAGNLRGARGLQGIFSRVLRDQLNLEAFFHIQLFRIELHVAFIGRILLQIQLNLFAVRRLGLQRFLQHRLQLGHGRSEKRRKAACFKGYGSVLCFRVDSFFLHAPVVQTLHGLFHRFFGQAPVLVQQIGLHVDNINVFLSERAVCILHGDLDGSSVLLRLPDLPVHHQADIIGKQQFFIGHFSRCFRRNFNHL